MMGDGCYTWERECQSTSFPNPCAQAAATVTCAETPLWFWVLAGALGVALFVGGKK